MSYFDLDFSKIFEVRGEDVPFWVKEFGNNGRKVIGLTGEDLYLEFCLKENNNLIILKRIQWNDSKALFSKPTLCLICSKDLNKLPKNITVCICSKYKEIANNYLKKFKNYNIKKIYVNGSVELSCSEGIADLIIDIVYTGKSLDKYGLKVYDKIFRSNFLIIAPNGSPKESYINKLVEV